MSHMILKLNKNSMKDEILTGSVKLLKTLDSWCI